MQNMQQMTDIHDIKPMEILGYDISILIYLVIGILIIAIIYGLYLIYKKRKTKKKKIDIVPPSPEEVAFLLLDELSQIDSIDIKEFYFRLSAVFRGYLQGRSGIDALEMTTEELLPKLNEIESDRELRGGIRELLNWSDSVKFAGFSAQKAQMQKDFDFVKEFIKIKAGKLAGSL